MARRRGQRDKPEVSDLTSSSFHLTQMSKRLDIFFISAVGQFPIDLVAQPESLIAFSPCGVLRFPRCNNGSLRIPTSISSSK